MNGIAEQWMVTGKEGCVNLGENAGFSFQVELEVSCETASSLYLTAYWREATTRNG